MRYTRPNYYHQFKCIAGECPDTCCAGWEIAIDSKSIEKYQKYSGNFGNCLHNSVDWDKKCFTQYDDKCIFLNEENLCDMYSEAGSGMLCKTCRIYPRHMEVYPNAKEVSIALSCPEAARLILTNEEKVTLQYKNCKTVPVKEVDFDNDLFAFLLETRDVMITMLQKRSIPIQSRVGLVLCLAHDLQKRINDHDLSKARKLLSHYQLGRVQDKLYRKVESELKQTKRYATIKSILDNFLVFEVLNPTWPKRLKEAAYQINQMSEKEYNQKRSEFHIKQITMNVRTSASTLKEPIWKEQMMVYYLYGYLLGAVYDEDLYSKVKLAVVSMMITDELFFAEWLATGQLSTSVQLDIAHRYSREIEHLDANLNAFEELANHCSTYYLYELLHCIQ